jgi:hypothetical protein
LIQKAEEFIIPNQARFLSFASGQKEKHLFIGEP